MEDLLRLKRTERPPQAFWDSFEEEVRAQTLATLARDEQTIWRRIRDLARHVRAAIAAAAMGATALAAWTLSTLTPLTVSEPIASNVNAPEATAPAEVVRVEDPALASGEEDFTVDLLPVEFTEQPRFAREMRTDRLEAEGGERRFAPEMLSASRRTSTSVAVLSF